MGIRNDDVPLALVVVGLGCLGLGVFLGVSTTQQSFMVAVKAIDQLGPTLTTITAVCAAVWGVRRAWDAAQAQILAAENHRREDLVFNQIEIMEALRFDLLTLSQALDAYANGDDLAQDVGDLSWEFRIKAFSLNGRFGRVLNIILTSFRDLKYRTNKNHNLTEDRRAMIMAAQFEVLAVCVDNMKNIISAGDRIQLPICSESDVLLPISRRGLQPIEVPIVGTLTLKS